MRRRLLLLLLPLLAASTACRLVMDTLRPPATPVVQAIIHTATAPPAPTATYTLSPTSTWTSSPTPLPPTATAEPTLTPTVRPTVSPRHIQVFQELWHVVNEEYLYEDFNGVDWEAMYDEYLERIRVGVSNEEFYYLMDEMIFRLGDEHSVFFSPEAGMSEDAQYTGDYDYVGIGVLNTVVPERKRITVILVFPGSPAEQAGIRMHDSILAVDGQPIVDEDGVRQDLLRGPEGTTITITVQSPGEPPREVQLTRSRITSEMPVPYDLLQSPAGQRIGYLLLPTFNESSIDRKVGEALRAMQATGPLDGLIIDNRQNEGGASNVLSGTLGYFTGGVVGHFVNRDRREALNVIGMNVNGSQALPLVVLVGKGTVSFGEIFSGILQDLDRAHLIGETTEGNVEILWVYNFSDGSRVWLAHDTFAPLNSPDANWEETGIIPDEFVPSNWDEVTTETDPAIRSALEHFDRASD